MYQSKNLTATTPKTSWTPTIAHGTWRPRGRRLIGPVTYIQRVHDQPTGLFFTVPRQRYWWICTLVRARNLPLLGRFAQRVLARMQVEYYWTWQPNVQTRAEA